MMLTKSKVQNSTTPPLFHNMRSLLQLVDSLPHGPEWSCEILRVEEDRLDNAEKPRVEHLELWKRDPVECIKELIGNPAFKDNMKYKPYHVYETPEGVKQYWDEMATGDWWWNMQVRSCLS